MPTSKSRQDWIAARSTKKFPDPKRARRRQTLRQRAALMHAMLAEIGRNPVYGNHWPLRVERGSPADRSWSKQAKAWLEANMKRYMTA
jgi:disulfide oxidoreductase YuzD